jgi:hypothetical protein
MIMEEIGSAWNVEGKRREMAAAGPIPGRTPTRVPNSTPIRAKARFFNVRATVNP